MLSFGVFLRRALGMPSSPPPAAVLCAHLRWLSQRPPRVLRALHVATDVQRSVRRVCHCIPPIDH
jgi:hypothetical protein